jgi:hypothetical protein
LGFIILQRWARPNTYQISKNHNAGNAEGLSITDYLAEHRDKLGPFKRIAARVMSHVACHFVGGEKAASELAPEKRWNFPPKYFSGRFFIDNWYMAAIYKLKSSQVARKGFKGIPCEAGADPPL